MTDMYQKTFVFWIIWLFLKPSSASGNESEINSITVSPKFIKANENELVVINCNTPFKENVKWMKFNEMAHGNYYQVRNQLVIPKAHLKDTGFYICFFKDKLGKNRSRRAFVQVISRLKTDGYSAVAVSTLVPYITKESITTPKPEFFSSTTQNLFKCSDGQTINKFKVCDYKSDCKDGSDESQCVDLEPKITSLPEKKTEILCGDGESGEAGELVLKCTFAGHPEPLVKWKKYEGHVPMKCQQLSKNGHGTLVCPNFQQSDQGSYSCVAENKKGSAESQPKSVVKCSNAINCKGFRVISEDDIENCLECYCSGRTDECHNIGSNVTISKIPFPKTLTEIFAVGKGDVVFVPSESEIMPNPEDRKIAQGITYCQLSKEGLNEKSLLKSYGRNMNIPRYNGKIDFMPNAPDLIIQGNGVSLLYSFNVISHSARSVDVRFWPGNWYHLNKTAASRKDIMKVLANLDEIFFRCEYVSNKTLNTTLDILLESSTLTTSTKSVSFIEKCNCPKGYEGLSCESCASGYTKEVSNNGLICKPSYVPPPCEEGRTGPDCKECDQPKHYYKSGENCVKTVCHVHGSESLIPNSDGKCSCKKNVIGSSCEKCQSGYFNVQQSCLKCWCNGVSYRCSESNWVRTIISSISLGGYNSSEGRNFWLLPEEFNGNRLTSYGGYLNYTMKYLPNIAKQDSPLTVEFLTSDDVTISFTHSDIDTSLAKSEKTWVVKLVEDYWKKSNKNVTRQEFLSVLSNVKAIYIESPYHLSSGLVNMTSARMSSAVRLSNRSNEETASEVEECVCPDGYKGLSCESCDDGYYRSRNGSISLCVKCNCENCDPERGCLDCPQKTYRDNPMEELNPVCKPCPCNNNEVSCFRDSYGQIGCQCKPGFMGLYCENSHIDSNKSYLNVSISPSKIKSKKIGVVIPFKCSYTSFEKMKVVVRKTYERGSQMVVDNTKDSTTEHKHGVIKSFQITLDSGIQYVECIVYDGDETEIGHVKAVIKDLIEVVEPVKIKTCYSYTIDVLEKEEREIICRASGSPTPVVNWFRTAQSGELKKIMEKIDSVEGVHTILAEHSELSKNGTIYTCMAENSEGDKDMCSQVLIVREKCEKIHVNPKNITVVEGGKISLKCKGLFKKDITWSKLNSSLPYNRHTIKDGILEIINSTVDDSGIYVCKALAKTGYINDSAIVSVNEKKIRPKVSILSRDIVLNAGSSVDVTCVAKGKPYPTIIWEKVNGKMQSNVHYTSGKLSITNATLNNTGLYACKGNSIVGNAVAYINVVMENKTKPRVELNTGYEVRIIEGSNFTLNCYVRDGFPVPNLEWMVKNGYNWVKHSTGNSLTFYNMSMSHAGMYKCIGINSVGRDEAVTKLEVLVRPRVNISVDKSEVYTNQNITVSCFALGYPFPKLSWAGIPQTETFKRDNGFATIAPIKAIKEEVTILAKMNLNDNPITCTATNEAGSVNATAKLKVLLEHINNPVVETTEYVQLGSYFELMCKPTYGNGTWRKLNGKLEGDICPVLDGISIPSVQIQHAGTYICTSTSEMELDFKKVLNLIVVGFVPKFSNKAYMIFPVNIPEIATHLRIVIFFRPESPNGVLLHEENYALKLYLKDKKVHLYTETEKNNTNIRCQETIQLHKWYSLTVIITKTYIDITIYNETSSIFERLTERFNHSVTKISGKGNFVLGGAAPIRTSMKIKHAHHLFRHTSSFNGCISRLIINNHEFDLVKESSYSKNVTLCKACTEKSNTCGEEGKCFDAPTQYGFICACPDNNEVHSSCTPNCVGKGCETQLKLCELINPCNGKKDLHNCITTPSSLKCSCAFGYSGTICEKVTEYSFCVKGNGFVTLPSEFLDRGSIETPEVIKISFYLEKPNGILLWQGNKDDHLLIAVRNLELQYTYFTQEVALTAFSKHTLPLEKKIKMTATRKNSTVTINIESESEQLVKFTGRSSFVTNRVEGDIYLGNMPQNIPKYSSVYQGLHGCISKITFGNQQPVNLRLEGIARHNTIFSQPWDYDYQYEDSENSSS